jgi:hypothetical protein
VLNIEPDFEIPANFWLLGNVDGYKLLSTFSSSTVKQNPKYKHKCLFEDKLEFLDFLTMILKSVYSLRNYRNIAYEFRTFDRKELDRRTIETQLRQLKLTKTVAVFKSITNEILKLFPDVCCDRILPCYIETKEPLYGLRCFAKANHMMSELRNYIQNYYQTCAPKPNKSSLLHRIMDQHIERSFDSDEFAEYTD